MKYLLPILLCFLPFFSISQTQIGNDIDGENSLDESGFSVALSDDGLTVVIGSTRNDDTGFDAGHVRVFQYSSNSWTQVGESIGGEASEDYSGNSVDLSSDGSVLAIGAANNDGGGTNAGHVRVYENIDGNWTQIGEDIDGESSGDRCGFRVSLSDDGNILAVSAIDNDDGGSDAGQVRVFENNSGTWEQLGADIDGESSGDESGYGLSLSSDGSMVAIGARLNDDNGTNSGKVKVYEFSMNSWTQVGQDILGFIDQLGSSVSLSSDGSIVAVGAPANDDNGNASGLVRVYENNEDTWTQIGDDINGMNELDQSGRSVSLSSDGSILAIGAPSNNSDNNNEGYVTVYLYNSGSWMQIGEVIYGEEMLDYSGGNVSLSSDGSVLAIGARANNGNGADSGHTRIYDLSAILSADEFVQVNFKVYPNPTTNFVNVQLSAGLQLEKVNVYSISGRLIKTDRKTSISTEDLSKGSYFIEVITNQGKATKTIVVE
ncbi:T9SS type A sorting domain-containing protein [Halocola ammonii]